MAGGRFFSVVLLVSFCAYTAADDANSSAASAMANRAECLCLKALELLMRFLQMRR